MISNNKNNFGKYRVAFAALLAVILLAGPGYSNRVGDTYAKFDLENYSEVWDIPFPNDLHVIEDGSINMEGFPDTFLKKTVGFVKNAVSHGYGFSTNPVIYFSFNKPLHQKRIPPTLGTTQPGAAIFMMDIDPDSPERGRLFPLRIKFEEKRPRLNFGPKNLLSIMPVPGFALREKTTYAVVLMDTLRDGDHLYLNCPPALDAIRKGNVPAGALGNKAYDLYRPMFDYLKERGVNIDRISAATVFTTGDPTARMRKMFDAVSSMTPPAFSEPLKVTQEYDRFYVLEGAVMMPQFQPGIPPFEDGKGGVIQFDASDKPVVAREERVPVCVTVPKGKMPASGWPLMIYIHGTAGVSTQFVDRGVVKQVEGDADKGTGPAMILAHRGIAAVGAALPQNGQRGYDPMMIPYYNFFNIEAMRDNFIQSVAEQAILLRIMKNLKIDPKLCPATDASDGSIFFDPELIFSMGQSLGSMILDVWGAVETDLKVVIPSGSGVHFGVFIATQNPFDNPKLKKKGVGIGENFGLDMFHPFVSLAQTAIGPADPGTFAQHIIRNPLPGRKPKNVWISLGEFDHYFSSEAQNAIIADLGVDFVGEVNDGLTPEILALAGRKPIGFPVTGNITAKDGSKITGVALQFEQFGKLDGHHINFQRNDTKYEYGCFLRSYIDNGVPTLYAPRESWDAKCE